jgi:hypothetical protein
MLCIGCSAGELCSWHFIVPFLFFQTRQATTTPTIKIRPITEGPNIAPMITATRTSSFFLVESDGLKDELGISVTGGGVSVIKMYIGL